jgi:PadR family transcriptional regulator, regulatory protein PadR
VKFDPNEGYGIIQRIRQLSDELLEVEQGCFDPAVYRIEQRGWISSKWGVTETGGRDKFYTLTK